MGSFLLVPEILYLRLGLGPVTVGGMVFSVNFTVGSGVFESSFGCIGCLGTLRSCCGFIIRIMVNEIESLRSQSPYNFPHDGY